MFVDDFVLWSTTHNRIAQLFRYMMHAQGRKKLLQSFRLSVRENKGPVHRISPFGSRIDSIVQQQCRRSFFDFSSDNHMFMRSTTGNPSTSFSTQAQQTAMQQLGLWGPIGGVRPSTRTVPRSRRQRPGRSHYLNEPLNLADKIFPVTAIHVAQTIDILSLASNLFTNENTSPATKPTLKKEMFGKNSIVIRLAPSTEDPDRPRFIAIFRFGSVVFLNVSPRETAEIVDEIKAKHCKGAVLQGIPRKEQFGVLVDHSFASHADAMYAKYANSDKSTEDGYAVVTGDYCVVPELDMNGFAVISNIMAQTVALDTYNDSVDDLLSNFTSVNSSVTKTGHLTSADKNFLFKTVAQNNSIFIDMISKIRIKDRSDTAWNLTKYEKIHYGLKDEFELDDRFDMIETKLAFIQQNSKFFLEVLQHQKTNSLEWIIVLLITLECGLMCVEMSGMGEVFFSRLGSMF